MPPLLVSQEAWKSRQIPRGSAFWTTVSPDIDVMLFFVAHTGASIVWMPEICEFPAGPDILADL